MTAGMDTADTVDEATDALDALVENRSDPDTTPAPDQCIGGDQPSAPAPVWWWSLEVVEVNGQRRTELQTDATSVGTRVQQWVAAGAREVTVVRVDPERLAELVLTAHRSGTRVDRPHPVAHRRRRTDPTPTDTPAPDRSSPDRGPRPVPSGRPGENPGADWTAEEAAGWDIPTWGRFLRAAGVTSQQAGVVLSRAVGHTVGVIDVPGHPDRAEVLLALAAGDIKLPHPDERAAG